MQDMCAVGKRTSCTCIPPPGLPLHIGLKWWVFVLCQRSVMPGGVRSSVKMLIAVMLMLMPGAKVVQILVGVKGV